MSRSLRPWVVVLAGGDGRRLDGAIVDGQRWDRPKQFCDLEGESLLRRTLLRSECVAEPERTVAVVRDEHRRWWQGELRHLPSENVLSQVDNRGTAVAILHALVHVLQRDDDPTLVLLPSDHAAERETVLVESVNSAAQSAAAGREHLVLLGITPDRPETGYGWILPRPGDTARVREVARFVEKPQAHVAAGLHAAGGLWNSFIFASSARALIDLFEASQPLLARRHLESFLVQRTNETRGQALFRALPCVDFSCGVLQSTAARLRVLTVPPCGWTDLGTPQRVNDWLERSCSFRPEPANHWMEAHQTSGDREAVTTA